MPNSPAVEIINVTKDYGDRRALDRVCLTVDAGSRTAPRGSLRCS